MKKPKKAKKRLNLKLILRFDGDEDTVNEKKKLISIKQQLRKLHSQMNICEHKT